jgi:hypothetical protein
MLAKDEDALVRSQAAQALARMKCSAAAQALIRGLKDPDDLVRDVCIFGLGSLRDVQGIFPLEDMRSKLSRSASEEAPSDLERHLDWAIRTLKAVEAPSRTPDRRRGGVSKKISRALDRIQQTPRDGIAHNNLAVAYFHAAEFSLAMRHCLLARELGARVEWLWSELVEAGHDPGGETISPQDRAFLDEESGPTLQLEREPGRSNFSSPGEGGGGRSRERQAPPPLGVESPSDSASVAASPDAEAAEKPVSSGARETSGVTEVPEVSEVRDPLEGAVESASAGARAESEESSTPAREDSKQPSPQESVSEEVPEGRKRRKKRRKGKKRRGRS